MRALRNLVGRMDDAAPIEMLTSLFEANGWEYQLSGENELVAEVQGSWAKYQLQALWHTADRVLQLLCIPDIHIPEDKRQFIHEALMLVNGQVWLGHFDMWSDRGMLLYRHAILLGDDGGLGPSQAQFAVEVALEECDRFYPVFQFILWSDKTPAEAIKAAMVDAMGEA